MVDFKTDIEQSMCEQMEFPKTFEEFLDEYSFIDSEEVYTNKSELIQKFRVEQGYEHFEQEIRAEERRKFAEWLDKSEKYSLSKVIQCWEDSRYNQYLTVNIDEILSEYEQMKG